jgi:hypothetical protein
MTANRCVLAVLFNVIFAVALPALGGCSAHRTSSTTTTETTEEPRARYAGDPAPSEVETTKTVETHSDTEHEEHHGLFGILADIITLPFRAVGALLDAIF